MNMEKLRDNLMKFAQKLNANVYLQIIRDAMLAYMPFTISTGLFLILANFPVQAVTDWICKVFNCDFFTYFMTITQLYRVGLGIGGFIVLLTTAISAAKRFEADITQSLVTAVISFLVLIPLGEGNTLRQSDLSANNMFMALVVGICAVKLYKFLVDKNIKIKMPKSVPDMVSKPIESLIPSFITMMLFWAIRLTCGAFGTTFAAVIVAVLGTPMKLVTGNIFGVVFTQIFTQLLWFFGIHGGSITTAFVSPVYQMLSEENRAAALAGLPVPNIISNEFGNFCGIGVIGAVVAALIVARS
ncbi:MAG: PTS sugar transporter subunit IIC, partial [Erysipelotrichaceae bacterium]|nr:PTS sugar transporter subunit IIC [Erysipelotrichaceae bacterium]